MAIEPDSAANAGESPTVTLTLSVWAGRGTHWRARAVFADASRLEFQSPFELARYVAWPMVGDSDVADSSLR